MTITDNFIGIGVPPIQATMLEDTFKITVREADGTPSVENVKTIVVSNGTLTDDGNGQVTLSTGSGSGTITLTGDVTASGTSPIATTIANDAVTYAKIQNVAANSVLARAANSSGDVSAVALSASQLLGRGSTGDVAAITLGSGLTISGTTLNTSTGTWASWTPTISVDGTSVASSTVNYAYYVVDPSTRQVYISASIDVQSTGSGSIARISTPSGYNPLVTEAHPLANGYVLATNTNYNFNIVTLDGGTPTILFISQNPSYDFVSNSIQLYARLAYRY